jgi:uncharacterized protein (DUF433 family)
MPVKTPHIRSANPRNDLTPREHAELIQRLGRLRDGERLAQLMAEYGVTRFALKTLRREAGIPSRFLSPAERAQVITDRAEGDRVAVVAARYGVTPRRVQQLAREAGLSPRSATRSGTRTGEER